MLFSISKRGNFNKVRFHFYRIDFQNRYTTKPFKIAILQNFLVYKLAQKIKLQKNLPQKTLTDWNYTTKLFSVQTCSKNQTSKTFFGKKMLTENEKKKQKKRKFLAPYI